MLEVKLRKLWSLHSVRFIMNKAVSLAQVGVIHPQTDVESVVRHAYENALFLCEQVLLV